MSATDAVIDAPPTRRDWLALAVLSIGLGLIVLDGTIVGVALPDIIANGDIARLPENFHAFPLHTVHVFVGRILAGIVVLHVCGALYHHFFLKDGLLARMSLAGR